MAYCLLVLIGNWLQKQVFGELRVSELQNFKDKFWNLVFYKFIFIFGRLHQFIKTAYVICSYIIIIHFNLFVYIQALLMFKPWKVLLVSTFFVITILALAFYLLIKFLSMGVMVFGYWILTHSCPTMSRQIRICRFRYQKKTFII
jgi:hypothetical protein